MRFFVPLVILTTTVVCGGDAAPLQRLRTSKDIRWTFDFGGMPNDPTSVKIDTMIHSTTDTMDVSGSNDSDPRSNTGDHFVNHTGHDDDGIPDIFVDVDMSMQLPSSTPSVSTHPTMMASPTLGPSAPVTSISPSLMGPFSVMPSLVSPSTVMPTTVSPSTVTPTLVSPSTLMPTFVNPSTVLPTPSPSASPSLRQDPSRTPSLDPSRTPSVNPSRTPSLNPSRTPTLRPDPTRTPSDGPRTPKPSTTAPISAPITVASSPPSMSPSGDLRPTPKPSTTSNTPVAMPSSSPSLSECGGITKEQRAAQIMAIIEAVSDPILLQNLTTSQGQAIQWLINEDKANRCPDNPKLIQRWAMATFYFSTGGEQWFRCSHNTSATDPCGTNPPFAGDDRFLSEGNECLWAGIKCSVDGCVTEIEFEYNNLVGSIPTELGLLSDLELLGMENGGLSGRIPTQLGQLSNLYFIDMDYNLLSGSLPTELYQLTLLEQLDLNDNLLTGNIEGVTAFARMEFMQFHANFLTGTVPDGIGDFSNLRTLTVQDSQMTGTMPASICDLVAAGTLQLLIADCLGPNEELVCTCCTDCRAG